MSFHVKKLGFCAALHRMSVEQSHSDGKNAMSSIKDKLGGLCTHGLNYFNSGLKSVIQNIPN